MEFKTPCTIDTCTLILLHHVVISTYIQPQSHWTYSLAAMRIKIRYMQSIVTFCHRMSVRSYRSILLLSAWRKGEGRVWWRGWASSDLSCTPLNWTLRQEYAVLHIRSYACSRLDSKQFAQCCQRMIHSCLCVFIPFILSHIWTNVHKKP